MNSTPQKAVAHVNDDAHIYRDPRNTVTLILWGVVLASHAILIPRLVRELYRTWVKHSAQK
jgi:hypothetical protein